MQPLDLNLQPPRGPREKLGGLSMLPRTIDKARAMLPGGNLGGYWISPGMSAFLLSKIGVTEAAFVEIVAAAEDDEAVLRALPQGRFEPERCARLNGFIEALTVGRLGELDASMRDYFDRTYGERDPGELVIDVIEADDSRNHLAKH